MIRIGLIGPDQLVADTLKSRCKASPRLEGSMICSSAEAFFKYFRGDLDIVLLDVQLPGMSGLEALPKICQLAPASKVVMLTSCEDDDAVFKALRGGAAGYLIKKSSLPLLEKLLWDIHRGIPAISPSILSKLLNYFSQQPQGDLCKDLTQKEREVLQLLVEGLSYKQIAGTIHISINGVRYHIKNIYRKLQINSRSELFQLFRDGQLSLLIKNAS